jgi:hypothetical protein
MAFRPRISRLRKAINAIALLGLLAVDAAASAKILGADHEAHAQRIFNGAFCGESFLGQDPGASFGGLFPVLQFAKLAPRNLLLLWRRIDLCEVTSAVALTFALLQDDDKRSRCVRTIISVWTRRRGHRCARRWKYCTAGDGSLDICWRLSDDP